MGGTKLTTVEDMNLASLAVEELDEIYRGAPDRFSDPGDESPVIQTGGVTNAPNVDAEGDAMVLLVNIDYTEEKIFIPEGNRWSGRTEQFTNGRLITDRDTANKILAAAPHVYEEPKSGEWMTHDESGFQTRVPSKFARYTQMWADNR